MKYFNPEEVERIGRAGSAMLAESIPAFRYLSSYWLYVEPWDEAFTPHGPSGYWESWITAWISQQFDNNDLFVDVGANVGYYTMLGEKYGIPTWAFEPNPEVYSLLRKTLVKNKSRNTVAYPYALGEAEATTHLVVPPRHSGGAFLAGEGGIEVAVIPFDRFYKGTPQNILMKIDAEGYEPQIWAGMQKHLETKSLTVCLEWESSRWRNNGEEFAQELFKQPYVAVLDFDGTEKQRSHYSQLQNLQGLQTVIVRNH